MKEFTTEFQIVNGDVYIKVSEMARFFREVADGSWNPAPFKQQAEVLEAAAYRVLSKSKDEKAVIDGPPYF